MLARAPGFGDQPPEKVNYRAVGRGTGGVFKRRTPIFNRDLDAPTPSSVPTKYQTVLYRDNLERKGFACRAPRFVAREREALPGPASYVPDPDMDPAHAPVSARGKGPFASRSPRWVHPSKLHGYVPPGPGAYAPEDGAASPSSPSAAFSLPGPGNPAKYYAEPEPGPGAYDAIIAPAALHPPKAPVFGSGRNALPELGGSTDGPGPAQYDLREEIRSPRKRPEPLEPPPTEAQQIRKGQALLAEVRSSPGPGQYSPREGDCVAVSKRGHSAFQLGNHAPRTWRGPQPGPTDYAQAASPRTELRALSSMVSQSRRFKKLQPKAPGPAYYAPKVTPEMGAASFHLNMGGAWV
ncbi:unnamed protein product [Effrenium voratum]|nr:unnamed protein product [Effrenium voratum]